ncbi:MAG: tetratricopeptide repeat protein [Fervidobacterium sp.]
MKKNLLVFLKTIVALILLVSSLFSPLLFSISVNDILEKSKSDPEFAWDMYLTYISQLSEATDTFAKESKLIDELGKKLYAKRKLSNLDFAIKEDIPGLINFLKKNAISEIKYYILDIFTEDVLREYFKEHLDNLDTLHLLKLIPITDDKIFSQKLIAILLKEETSKAFFENILPSTPASSMILDNLVNEIEADVKVNILNKDEEKVKLLIELYKRVITYYPSYKSTELEKIVKKSSRNLSDILQFMVSFISSIISSVKGNLKIVAAGMVLLSFILLFSIKIIRYRIFLLLGMKKAAVLTYKRIVEKDPLNEEKRLKLAQLYENAGMYEEAMNEYNFLKRIRLE